MRGGKRPCRPMRHSACDGTSSAYRWPWASARRIPRNTPMNERQTNPRKPHLVVIAGPNGSGKTTVMRRMVDLSWFPGACVIDPDAVAAALPGGFREAGNAARAAGRLLPRPSGPPGYFLRPWLQLAGGAMRFVRAPKGAGYVAHPLFFHARPGHLCLSRRLMLHGGRSSYSRGSSSAAITANGQ